MFNDYDKQIFSEALDKWGEDAQINMFHEEIGELLQALNKYRRGRIERQELISEVADVLIMLGQLMVMYPMEMSLTEEIGRKISRLVDRINERE